MIRDHFQNPKIKSEPRSNKAATPWTGAKLEIELFHLNRGLRQARTDQPSTEFMTESIE